MNLLKITTKGDYYQIHIISDVNLFYVQLHESFVKSFFITIDIKFFFDYSYVKLIFTK